MSSSSTGTRDEGGIPSRERRVEELSAEELLLGPESTEQPTLSVVLPTLNEEEGISICIDQIKHAIETLQLSAEIIVSDSSTDRTPVIARANGAIVVEPSREGYGEAYKRGFREARGDYIVMGDADTTYDFTELPKLFDPVFSGDADLVMGSRFEGEIRPGSMPRLHKWIGNPLLTRFLNVFYDADVTDAHSGFRVFTREALDELALKSAGMEFASEMVMDATTRGLTIEEVPIQYHERVGEETLNSFRDGWRHVRFMLVNAPGHLFSGPGIFSILAGVVIMGISIFQMPVGGVAFGLHTIAGGSLLTIVGFQLVYFGFFSSIAADSIREPDDKITTWVRNHFHLEHGVTAGLAVATLGSLGLAYVLVQGLSTTGSRLPSAVWTILFSTTVVLGILTVFSSFFMSILAAENEA